MAASVARKRSLNREGTWMRMRMKTNSLLQSKLFASAPWNCPLISPKLETYFQLRLDDLGEMAA